MPVSKLIFKTQHHHQSLVPTITFVQAIVNATSLIFIAVTRQYWHGPCSVLAVAWNVPDFQCSGHSSVPFQKRQGNTGKDI